jgi:uncharacterized protein (TIGR03435 family)
MTPDAPQGHFTSSGPDYFFAQGFTLRAILAPLLNADEHRIEMPPDFDRDERYEFRLRLPAPETWQALKRRVLKGITRHFDLCITRERRLLDVYVLTAPHGETLALHRVPEQDGGLAGAWLEYFTVGEDRPEPGRPPAHGASLHTIGPLSMSASTLGDLARSLEELIGHPVVDETGLGGRYDIEVRGTTTGSRRSWRRSRISSGWPSRELAAKSR